MSLQSMLVTWMLIGVLAQPPSVLGTVRSLMTIPPLILLLVGGLWADRTDLKSLVVGATFLALLPPLLLVFFPDLVAVWSIAATGIGLALIQGISDPARNAMINSLTRFDIQRSVALVFIVPTLASFGAVWIGGKQELIGIQPSFLILVAMFSCSLAFVMWLPKIPTKGPHALGLLSGLRSLLSHSLLRDIVSINFVSAMFNAGAYSVAAPLIASRIYGGDAEFFALMVIAFMVGSTSSNAILFLIMPVLRLGKWFLILQLTRAAILAGIFLQPRKEIFLVLIGLWGLNMGCTSTFARSMVQELAPAEIRAQILSFFLFSFMLAAPISSFLLGWLIEWRDPLVPMLIGIPISVGIFLYGLFVSGLWKHRFAMSRPGSGPLH